MNAFGGKAVQVTPPEKGSFPLDHYGECKSQMKKFLDCLKENGGAHHKCRELSKSYLECRMTKGLMQKENLDEFGFSAEIQVDQSGNPLDRQKEAKGFTAGLGVKSKFHQQHASKDS